MAAKTTAEVVERQSEEDRNTATVAVAAKAIVEGGGVAGRQGGGGDRSDSCHGVQRSLSDVVDNHRSTGESWSNTSPNNDGESDGGGEKNRHTTSSYRRQTAILPDHTDSRGGVLDIVHCRRVGGGGVGGVGVGGAHPSDDRKDDDESGGRGDTRDFRGDCDDVARYRRRHIRRGCDQDYDDDDDNAGHTT
jgi:hypothetical protein